MSSQGEVEFDVEAYQSQHKPPSEAESAFLTIAMFCGLVVFAVGCFLLTGWG